MRIVSTALVAVGIAAGLAQQVVAQGPPAAPRTREQLLSAPTPRTAQGHPDLSGVWNRAVPAPNAAAAGPRAFYLYDGSVPSQANEVQSAWAVRDADFYWLEIDQEIILKGNRENLPLYKPEYLGAGTKQRRVRVREAGRSRLGVSRGRHHQARFSSRNYPDAAQGAPPVRGGPFGDP